MNGATECSAPGRASISLHATCRKWSSNGARRAARATPWLNPGEAQLDGSRVAYDQSCRIVRHIWCFSARGLTVRRVGRSVDSSPNAFHVEGGFPKCPSSSAAPSKPTDLSFTTSRAAAALWRSASTVSLTRRGRIAISLPELGRAGYRAVAPFNRGFAPTELPADRHHVHTSTMVADALALNAALAAARTHFLIAHDWGAVAAWGAAGNCPDRWGRCVILNIPPFEIFGENIVTYEQIKRSFYFWYFQLQRVIEGSISANNFEFIDRIWADWSPGYDASEDLPLVKDWIRDPRTCRRRSATTGASSTPRGWIARVGEAQKAAGATACAADALPARHDDGCHGMSREQVSASRSTAVRARRRSSSRASGTSCSSSAPRRSTTASSASCSEPLPPTPRRSPRLRDRDPSPGLRRTPADPPASADGVAPWLRERALTA